FASLFGRRLGLFFGGCIGVRRARENGTQTTQERKAQGQCVYLFHSSVSLVKERLATHRAASITVCAQNWTEEPSGRLHGFCWTWRVPRMHWIDSIPSFASPFHWAEGGEGNNVVRPPIYLPALPIASTTCSTWMRVMQRKSIGHTRRKQGEQSA